MSREIQTAIANAIKSGQFSPYYCVNLNFFDGVNVPVNVWTGAGSLTQGGYTFTGVGDLLQIGQLEEAAELKASGMTLTLNGVNPTILDRALQAEYSGRVGRVFLYVGGVSGLLEVFTGRMDTLTVTDGPDASTIEVTLENRLIDLERPNPYRYTMAGHKAAYGVTDLFFSFTQDLQDQQVDWGPKE